MTALIELKDLHAGYDQSAVLNGLDITVGKGEVVAILGVNGAGKTTTMNVITGLVAPTSGEILFQGRNLLEIPAYRRVEAGICLSPEGRQVFPNLSVEDNLILGSFCPRSRPRRAQALAEVYELFPRLVDRRKQSAGLLSGGEQQMLAIGRAMMGCPSLLLLDEPSLGLAPRLVHLVFDAIAKIAESGISILIVEQNSQAALSVAQRGYVIVHGEVFAEAPVGELMNMESVKTAFLGSTARKPRTEKGSASNA
ncbi:branched-chain amino acid transport system ATP-binding protein [Roseovarius sp. MBR-51]